MPSDLIERGAVSLAMPDGTRYWLTAFDQDGERFVQFVRWDADENERELHEHRESIQEVRDA